MLSSSASLFTSLPARPPTPPKDVQEHVQNALDFLENGHDEPEEDASDISKRHISTDTPPVSSPVSSVAEAPTGSNATKKVGFSPFPPTFHEVPKSGVSSSPRDRLLRSTPRLRHTKPIKSILKLSSFAPPPTPDEQEQRLGYFSPDDPASFGKMLQSVLTELVSSSRSSRLDAYLALNGALTAYDGIPDRQAMAATMSQFQQCLSRDLIWRDSSGLIDTQIANQALKLTCAIVFDSQLSKAIDDDFRVFLMDRSITVMEQPDIPKALVKMHLYLVAQQKFHHSIMTSNRADRIISALRTIEDRCSSNSLIATRLVIYQKLLDQAPAVMSARLKDWLEHVFHGMLSSINDTRTRAIEVGNHAGFVLGKNPTASKALQELFETEVEEGQCYCDYLSFRLTSMIGDKEKQAGVFVPQIWSAVILFFRVPRKPIEHWRRLRTWLQILQKCLNSSDSAVRIQANLAWKKLVFTVMPDASTTPTMLSMLKVPINAGFQKRDSDRAGKQARQLALDGYHNLLHYSMRPSSSHTDLDVTWDGYVGPILLDMIGASYKGRMNACRVLHGLLSPNAGVWNEHAALNATAIRSQDLPRLEPRWLRSRLTKVLELVEPIISAGLWGTDEEGKMASGIWQQTLQSIAEAGAQEVKTSNELREAIALVMNMFQRIWHATCDSDSPNAAAASSKLQNMMLTTCQYIGPSLLAEDILARTSEGDAEAAPTPSHRPSKHQNACYSPLLSILTMMCSNNLSGSDQQWCATAAEIVELSCKSKSTSAARLQLLNRISQVLRTSLTTPEARQRVIQIWTLFADGAAEALQHSKTESTPSGTLGQKLRDAISIVISGLPTMHLSPTHSEAGLHLITEAVAVARCKAGDAGIVLSVTEPLSKALLDKDASIDISTQAKVATALLASAGWPHNRSSIENGRKMLWGVGSGPHKAGTFDPHEHLYALARDVSKDSYSCIGSNAPDIVECPSLLVALTTFIRNCPPALFVNTLRQVQDALIVWIEDEQRKVLSDFESASSQSVLQLWAQILAQLTELPRKEGSLLFLLQPLMVAGFASHRRAIVNQTIVFWNESFGEQDTLRYPSKLENVLRAARPYVELLLPGFPETAPGVELTELPAFSGAQEKDSQVDNTASSSSRWTGILRGTASPVKRPGVSHDTSSHLATIDTTGTNSASESSAKSAPPTARLRHDDSQVLFAPIESSPLPATEDSQLLTDHQKETRARQSEAAQMFPDISSTPVKKSTPHSKRKTPGTLDFSANVEVQATHDDVTSTPMEMPEAHSEMDDYMGSSPTPRGSDKSRSDQAQQKVCQDGIDEDLSSSPPGSPEQSKAANHDAHVNTDESFVADSAPLYEGPATSSKATSKLKQLLRDSDLPSDTTLPAQQLQNEADAAEVHADETGAIHETENQVDATTVVEPSDIGEEEDDAKDDTSRVENSFIEPSASQNSIAEPDASDNQHISRSGRKRKRAVGSADTAVSKKQKRQSPFRRVISGIFGLPQQEDEDVGEDIVVASSQPTDSPAAKRALKTENTPQDTQESATASQQPKRGRGRPRKSETPTPAPAPVNAVIPLASVTRSKRKASALMEGNDQSSEPATSEVKSTPAPKRQRRRAKAKKAIEEARKSQEESQEDSVSRPPSRREATAVVVEKSDADPEVVQTRPASDDEDMSGGEPQEKKEQDVVATPSRILPTETPKSILGRLKDIIGDCRNLIFGSQEEREFDDVLFELRKEVHGAAARGRQT